MIYEVDRATLKEVEKAYPRKSIRLLSFFSGSVPSLKDLVGFVPNDCDGESVNIIYKHHLALYGRHSEISV